MAEMDSVFKCNLGLPVVHSARYHKQSMSTVDACIHVHGSCADVGVTGYKGKQSAGDAVSASLIGIFGCQSGAAQHADRDAWVSLSNWKMP